MTLGLALLLVSVNPMRFPDAPILMEMARGERIYYDKKGIERTLMEDRVPVGRWFDGKIKRDTDQIIWLSPNMVSRWLGYLNAKEKWAKSELMERWRLASAALDGKLTFVAELYALPKESDYLELTEGTPSKPETATDVRFLVTSLAAAEKNDSQHIESIVGQKWKQSPLDRSEPRVSPLAIMKGYSLDSIQKWPWFSLELAFEPLAPQLTPRKPGIYDAVVGDHVRAVYVLQSEISEELAIAEKFSVRLFATGKEPVAVFNLVTKKKR